MTARFEVTAGLQLATGIACRHGTSDPTFGARSIVRRAFKFTTSAVAVITIVALPRVRAIIFTCGLGHEPG